MLRLVAKCKNKNGRPAWTCITERFNKLFKTDFSISALRNRYQRYCNAKIRIENQTWHNKCKKCNVPLIGHICEGKNARKKSKRRNIAGKENVVCKQLDKASENTQDSPEWCQQIINDQNIEELDNMEIKQNQVIGYEAVYEAEKGMQMDAETYVKCVRKIVDVISLAEVQHDDTIAFDPNNIEQLFYTFNMYSFPSQKFDNLCMDCNDN